MGGGGPFETLPRRAVFGVLNLTPDSFSDGGRYATATAAVERARAMVAEGADVIDVGAESTRPRGATYGDGYVTLSADDEWARLEGPLAALRDAEIPFSIDTTKPEVAARALALGARVVNDTGCGTSDALLREVARAGAGIVLMHNRGKGEVEGRNVVYGDVVGDVIGELSRATERATEAGVPDAHIAWDPGFGFAKTADQSLALLVGLSRIVDIGYPVMVGASRKSFLAARLSRAARRPEPSERLGASVAACVLGARAGARMFRVHDVRDSVQALELLALGGGLA